MEITELEKLELQHVRAYIDEIGILGEERDDIRLDFHVIAGLERTRYASEPS